MDPARPGILAYVLAGGIGLVLLSFIGLVVAGKLAELRRRATSAYGFVGTDGQLRLPPRWVGARSFSHGLAAVEVDGRWGFIDESGSLVIPARYHQAEDFDESGHAPVMDDKARAWGLIDRQGQQVLPPDMQSIYPVMDGVVVASRRVGLKTTQISGSGPDPIHAYGLRQLDGAWRIEPRGPEDPARIAFARVPAEDRVAVKIGERWGWMDLSGILVKEPVFDDLWPLSEGLAPARQGDAWGYVDARGDWVISPRFQRAGAFSEGLAPVTLGGAATFIGPEGEPVFAERFEQARPFAEGLAAVRIDGRWGFVDSNGAMVIPPRYIDVVGEGFSAGRAVVLTEDKDGRRSILIDSKGEVIGGPFLEVAPGALSQGPLAVRLPTP